MGETFKTLGSVAKNLFFFLSSFFASVVLRPCESWTRFLILILPILNNFPCTALAPLAPCGYFGTVIPFVSSLSPILMGGGKGLLGLRLGLSLGLSDFLMRYRYSPSTLTQFSWPLIFLRVLNWKLFGAWSCVCVRQNQLRSSRQKKLSIWVNAFTRQSACQNCVWFLFSCVPQRVCLP